MTFYQPPIRIGKYLRVAEEPATGKTGKWTVLTNGDVALGTIQWYGGWRCYVFRPEFGTEFNGQCMRDIVAFMDQQMAARAAKPRGMFP